MSILAALLLALPHRVYVSNEASDDVSVIENDAVVARIAVGKRPRGIKLGPGGKLYVAVSGSPRAGPGQREEDLPPADRAQDGIAVVDLGRGEVTGRLPGGPDPESFDLSADGKLLYVSNEDASALTVVDIKASRIVRSVKVGAQPEGVTVSPDGRAIYVTNVMLVGLFGGLGLAIGFGAVLAVQLPIMLLASIIGVWLFSVQHRFECTHWAPEAEDSAAAAR